MARPVMYGSLELPDGEAADPTVLFRPKPRVPATRVMAGALVLWSLLLAGLLVAIRRHEVASPMGTRLQANGNREHAAVQAAPMRMHSTVGKQHAARADRKVVKKAEKGAKARASKKAHGPQAKRLDTDAGTTSTDTDMNLEFAVTNEYGSHVTFQTVYPWLDGKKLIEPYRATTLTINEPVDGVTYYFTMYLGLDPSTATEIVGPYTASNASVVVTLTTTGQYLAEVKAVDADGNVLGMSTQSVFCKYVRREMRGLLKDDLNAFMDAAQTIWYTDMTEGVAKYGEDFKTIDFFNGYHLSMAALQHCDHMHDGLGFMTQHMALTLKFDKAIRAVSPKSTVPYWDFTMDVEKIRTQQDTNISMYFLQTDLFTDEYFGAVNATTHAVETGRWAKVPVKQSSLDVKNAYGLARAPWNTNKQPYITRYSNFCGKYVNEADLPTCEKHYDTIAEQPTWETFGSNLPYAPHGPIHVYAGGVIGCDDIYDKFLKLGLSETFASWFVYSSYIKIRDWYRWDIWKCPEYCSPDTEQDDCLCKCDVDELIEQYGTIKNVTALMVGDMTDMEPVEEALTTDEQLYELVKLMCETKFMVGDQIEAASPNDIMFWPMHPTLERLWMAKKLWGTFTDETWPDGTSVYGVTCGGHNANDVIPLKGVLDDDATYYTNQELYDLASPLYDNLPYIYDDFAWQHCVESAGIDFSDIPKDMGDGRSDIPSDGSTDGSGDSSGDGSSDTGATGSTDSSASSSSAAGTTTTKKAGRGPAASADKKAAPTSGNHSGRAARKAGDAAPVSGGNTGGPAASPENTGASAKPHAAAAAGHKKSVGGGVKAKRSKKQHSARAAAGLPRAAH